MEHKEKKSFEFAIASSVLTIIGIILMMKSTLLLFGVILLIIGFIVGIIAIFKKQKLVISIASIAVSILALIYATIMYINVFDDVLTRADDTDRMSSVSFLGVSIITYYSDFGEYPAGCGTLDKVFEVGTTQGDNIRKLTSNIYKDPDDSTSIGTIIGSTGDVSLGEFGYCLLNDKSFVLITKVNHPEKANWVYGGNTDVECNDTTSDLSSCVISTSSNIDYKNFCINIVPGTGSTNDGNGNCTYDKVEDLYYIYANS